LFFLKESQVPSSGCDELKLQKCSALFCKYPHGLNICAELITLYATVACLCDRGRCVATKDNDVDKLIFGSTFPVPESTAELRAAEVTTTISLR